MLVYFSASARDIKRDIEVYRHITNAVREGGGILLHNWPEAAVLQDSFPKDQLWWEEVCEGASVAIRDADIVIVEATGVSTLGVGCELVQALFCQKRTLALVKKGEPSSYVRGISHPLLKVKSYEVADIANVVGEFLREAR